MGLLQWNEIYDQINSIGFFKGVSLFPNPVVCHLTDFFYFYISDAALQKFGANCALTEITTVIQKFFATAKDRVSKVRYFLIQNRFLFLLSLWF